MDRPNPLRPRHWVAVFGVAGLIGFLLAAQATPAFATPLRIAAFVWFLGLGVYETIWRLRAGRRG